MRPCRPARALLVAVLALAPVAACSSDDGDDASPSTTTEPTTSTTEADTRTPRTVPDEVPGLGCDALAADGPPAGSGANDRPEEPVTFGRGQAVVLLTAADGTASCLDLQLSTGPADEHVLDGGGRSLDLRWEDGGLALQLGVTDTTIAEGPIDGFTRIEVRDEVWVDSMHTECEVRLDGVDATSIDGSVTCEAISSFGVGEPVAVVAAFHAEV